MAEDQKKKKSVKKSVKSVEKPADEKVDKKNSVKRSTVKKGQAVAEKAETAPKKGSTVSKKPAAPKKGVAVKQSLTEEKAKVPKTPAKDAVQKAEENGVKGETEISPLPQKVVLPPPRKHPPYKPVPVKAKKTATKLEEPTRFSPEDLEMFKSELISMREHILGRSGAMRNDALQGTDDINPEEDGTDAFLRLQTLDQVKNQHQLIANINTALRAIEKGTYGVCTNCGNLIRKQRLAVLPFANLCITCQSEMERQKNGRR